MASSAGLRGGPVRRCHPRDAFLVVLLGQQGTAGLTLPGRGIGEGTAMVWELVLTVGLVTTILDTASGAQNVGPMNAIGVPGYIVLAELFGAPGEWRLDERRSLAWARTGPR